MVSFGFLKNHDLRHSQKPYTCREEFRGFSHLPLNHIQLQNNVGKWGFWCPFSKQRTLVGSCYSPFKRGSLLETSNQGSTSVTKKCRIRHCLFILPVSTPFVGEHIWKLRNQQFFKVNLGETKGSSHPCWLSCFLLTDMKPHTQSTHINTHTHIKKHLS